MIDLLRIVREAAASRLELFCMCVVGKITCTSGIPGSLSATYAPAVLPLRAPQEYPREVRERHERNMNRLPDPEPGCDDVMKGLIALRDWHHELFIERKRGL